ncbi:MAG: hypothetical protein ACREIU_01780 [Planctomycetota bacterium]
MCRPRKKSPVKRGKKPSTIDTTPPKPVTFVDPQPPDRYNLVFLADYADKDAVLEKTDEAFLQIYHEEFPGALDSYSTWDTKAPSSRAHCKAAFVKKVGSLREIARNIKDFVVEHEKEGKKLGTVILSGHGNPEEFSLPVARSVKSGGKRVPLPLLEVGLRNADVIGDRAPSEWTWGEAKWKEWRSEFMAMRVEVDMLHKHLGTAWTDKETLLRCWCCNLGKPSKGPKDPLAILGGIFLGKGEFMVEAPQNKSGSAYGWFPIPDSAGEDVKAKAFREQKAAKGGIWHPDTVAEVESDKKGFQFVGPDLTSAQGTFFGLALRDPKTPDGKDKKWIPYFYVEDGDRKPVVPKDWAKFKALWRRVEMTPSKGG